MSPEKGRRTPKQGDVGTPRNSQAADIHISIQPPTDPAQSKTPSRAPKSQASTVLQDGDRTPVRSRTPVANGESPSRTPSRAQSRVSGVSQNLSQKVPSNMPSIPTLEGSSQKAPSITPSKGGRSKAGTIVDTGTTKAESVAPPVPEKDADLERRASSRVGDDAHVRSPSRVRSAAPSRASSVTPSLKDAHREKAPSISPSERIKEERTGGGSRSPSRVGASQVGQGRAEESTSHKPDHPHLHPLTGLIHQHGTSSAHAPPRAKSPLSASFPNIDGVLSPSPSKVSSRHQPLQSRKNIQDELAALERDITPTPSRAVSPQAERRHRSMTEKEALELLKTPRTSYTVTPTDLAAEVQKSHFHDEDLCVLLHVADDPTVHDVVRRAVRKAVRSRVKKLGFDTEAQV